MLPLTTIRTRKEASSQLISSCINRRRSITLFFVLAILIVQNLLLVDKRRLDNIFGKTTEASVQKKDTTNSIKREVKNRRNAASSRQKRQASGLITESHHNKARAKSSSTAVNDKQQQDVATTNNATVKVASTASDYLSVTTKTTSTARYAYAFVIGGCSPEKPSYRFYLYDILVAAQQLHEDGSQADIVVMIRMASDSNSTELPPQEAAWLQAMNVLIKYIPKSNKDTFYSIALDKFQILSLTEYKKVLFLDADVLPLGNLDYMFEMSDSGILKDNVVIPEQGAPSNAGFFLMTPYPGAMNDIDDIIRRKEERGMFDEKIGWGHIIESPDKWEKINKKRKPDRLRDSGTLWKFFGASADQGLLYYFTKYYRKNLSIIWASEVENYGPSGPDGAVVLEEKVQDPFANVRPPVHRGVVSNCTRFSIGDHCHAPMTDFEHFWSREKPWMQGPPKKLSEATKTESPQHLWFYTLTKLNEQLQMGLDEELRKWKHNFRNARAPLGSSFDVSKPRAENTGSRVALRMR